MTPEDKIYAALNVAGVTAHVGTRILPDVVPVELAMPAIAFYRLPSDQLLTLDTAYAGERALIEVECMAETRTKAEEIGDAARLALLLAHLPVVTRRADYQLDTRRFTATLSVNVWN